MFAEMSLEVETGCANSGDCGAGSVDLIGDALGLRLSGDVSFGLKSLKSSSALMIPSPIRHLAVPWIRMSMDLTMASPAGFQ